jgi:hypothetical protein
MYTLADWTGHILRRNCSLKDVVGGKLEAGEGQEEDVSSYLMTVMKKEDTII